MPTIRNLRHSDIDSAIALQGLVYPSIAAFRHDQFENLLALFPRGQFVAELDGLPGVNYLGRSASIILAGGSEACWV